ncbi:MAG: excinuclease ABC subunit UvrC [Candidatus Hydrogenedentota bacterium]
MNRLESIERQFNIDTELDTLPVEPGVYIFKDNENNIIYVGKAKNIKKRVSSYFLGKNLDYKTQLLVNKIKTVEVMVTDSELDALILENRLIKEFKPYFNIELKDDKTYPYLKIDISSDFPSLLITRKIQRDRSLYFGPYKNVYKIKRFIYNIQKLFNYRNCPSPLKKRKNTCLQYHLQLCPAPCTGYISKEEYQNITRRVLFLLRGKTDEIKKELLSSIEELSKELRFEEAAKLRDKLAAIESGDSERSKIMEHSSRKDMDAVAIIKIEEGIFINVMHFRKGIPSLDSTFYIQGNIEEDEKNIERIIIDLYQDKLPLPEIIYIKYPFNLTKIEEYLSQLQDRKVKIKYAGDKLAKKLINLSEKNAFARTTILKMNYLKKIYEKGIIDIMDLSGMDKLPERIECYDVSTISGKNTLGVYVVIEKGKLKKSEYRIFNIKLKLNDDFSAMKEVLIRRMKHKEWQEPDLFIIDGGRTHRDMGVNTLKEFGIKPNRILAIAKEEEKIFTEIHNNGVTPLISSDGMKLIIKLRDEAHRFAITSLRKKILKSIDKSIFDGIKGIGKKRKEKLFTIYKDIYKLFEEDKEDISKKTGIPLDVIDRVMVKIGNASVID